MSQADQTPVAVHPQAKVMIPTSEIRQNIEEIVRVNEAQETQLTQYSQLLEQMRAENKAILKRLKKLEKYEDLANDTAKYWPTYLRNPVVVDKLRARIIQLYGNPGNTASEVSSIRKGAARMLDVVVEECVRHGVFTIWHIIKRNLEEQGHAKRPART